MVNSEPIIPSLNKHDLSSGYVSHGVFKFLSVTSNDVLLLQFLKHNIILFYLSCGFVVK